MFLVDVTSLMLKLPVYQPGLNKIVESVDLGTDVDSRLYDDSLALPRSQVSPKYFRLF